MSQHPNPNDALTFITITVRDRMPIFANDAYAREAINALCRVQDLYMFFIHGFVIMPGLVHLLLNIPPEGSVSAIVDRYKVEVGLSIGLGSIWEPRFHLRLVEDATKVLDHIHENPDYPWLSARATWKTQRTQKNASSESSESSGSSESSV